MSTQYDRMLDEAALQWGSNAGETTEWARSALRCLIDGDYTENELALTVYSKLKPTDAKGRSVVPKLLNGRLTVRNLENTGHPVEGAAAARRSLEAVLLLYRERGAFSGEVEEFLTGRAKLFGAYNHIRASKRPPTNSAA